MKAGAEAEYHKAKEIIVHTPGPEIEIGALRPRGNLYEGPLSPVLARKEHLAMIKAFEDSGARVHQLRNLMLKGLDNPQRLQHLEDLARSSLSYHADSSLSQQEIDALDLEKNEVIAASEPEDLVNIIMSRYSVGVSRSSEGNMPTKNSYCVDPVANLMFMRDQMITTPNGIVLGKMNSSERSPEVDIVEYALGGLDIQPLLRISGEGRLEGGDYIPAGSFQLLGCGLRTNQKGIDQIVENQESIMGGKVLAVIYDPQSDQQHMHLDTYMNIIGHNKAVVSESRMRAGENNPIVQLYQGGRKLSHDPFDLPEFLRSARYNIAELTEEMQAAYAINGLTVEDGKFVGVDIAAKGKKSLETEYKKRLDKLGLVHADSIFVPANNLNNAYGAIHCLSQVVYREK